MPEKPSQGSHDESSLEDTEEKKNSIVHSLKEVIVKVGRIDNPQLNESHDVPFFYGLRAIIVIIFAILVLIIGSLLQGWATSVFSNSDNPALPTPTILPTLTLPSTAVLTPDTLMPETPVDTSSSSCETINATNIVGQCSLSNHEVVIDTNLVTNEDFHNFLIRSETIVNSRNLMIWNQVPVDFNTSDELDRAFEEISFILQLMRGDDLPEQGGFTHVHLEWYIATAYCRWHYDNNQMRLPSDDELKELKAALERNIELDIGIGRIPEWTSTRIVIEPSSNPGWVSYEVAFLQGYIPLGSQASSPLSLEYVGRFRPASRSIMLGFRCVRDMTIED